VLCVEVDGVELTLAVELCELVTDDIATVSCESISLSHEFEKCTLIWIVKFEYSMHKETMKI